MSGDYDAMQVCRSGHVITDSYHEFPGYRKSACTECGAETIHECEACGEEIQGRLKDVMPVGGEKEPPK